MPQQLNDPLLELTNLAENAAVRLESLRQGSVDYRMVSAELAAYGRAIDALMHFRKMMESEFKYAALCSRMI